MNELLHQNTKSFFPNKMTLFFIILDLLWFGIKVLFLSALSFFNLGIK